MCGISLILDYSGKVNADPIRRMMNSSQHRGPDASGYVMKEWHGGKLYMGSNRLQIVDQEEASNQPMHSEDGRYALLYNGEIYNFEEQRNYLLSKGVRFNTISDTEVVLNLLIHDGYESISSLNGMFAFVFADFTKQHLIVGRDAFGIKPLFVHEGHDKLIISSEINSILASGLVPKELNKAAIPHYLAYKYAPRPETFYMHIKEIMPGSLWIIDHHQKTKEILIKGHKDPPTDPKGVEQFLIDAVMRQYSTINSTGIMLSGGVDSTLLLAIINKELGYNHVPVFSIVSSGKEGAFASQDFRFASSAAKLYKAEYNEIVINSTMMNRLDEYILTIDQPVADSAALLTWILAEKANEEVKILLSGAGADEIFAGYNRHKAYNAYLKNRNKWWFNWVRQARHLPGWSPKLTNLSKLANSIASTPSATFNNFVQSDIFRLHNQSLWDESISNENHFRKALEHDQTNYLTADVLAITDHATMQHSIETRVPYLDNNLVKTARLLTVNELLKKGPKWILKNILSKYDGSKYAYRKKQGLGLPMDAWFGKKENKHWWDFNNEKHLIHTYVTSEKIDALIKKHSSGKLNATQELWRILVLHKWLNHNFE